MGRSPIKLKLYLQLNRSLAGCIRAGPCAGRSCRPRPRTCYVSRFPGQLNLFPLSVMMEMWPRHCPARVQCGRSTVVLGAPCPPRGPWQQDLGIPLENGCSAALWPVGLRGQPPSFLHVHRCAVAWLDVAEGRLVFPRWPALPQRQAPLLGHRTGVSCAQGPEQCLVPEFAHGNTEQVQTVLLLSFWHRVAPVKDQVWL